MGGVRFWFLKCLGGAVVRTIGFLVMLGVSVAAWGELQNVVVNGFFFIPESERSSSIVVELSTESEAVPLLQTTGWRYRLDVEIPMTASNPGGWNEERHLLLAFYTGRPSGAAEANTDASLIVQVNGQRATAFDRMCSDWTLRLVDVTGWRGQSATIQLMLSNPSERSGDKRRWGIALPRIVETYGPYYWGIGGLGAIGPHGSYLTSNGDKIGFEVDASKLTAPPLALLWHDIISPSTIRFASPVQKVVHTESAGLYCFPLRLDSSLAYSVEVDGKVENGRRELVPDFTIGDEAKLAAATKYLLEEPTAAK